VQLAGAEVVYRFPLFPVYEPIREDHVSLVAAGPCEGSQAVEQREGAGR